MYHYIYSKFVLITISTVSIQRIYIEWKENGKRILHSYIHLFALSWKKGVTKKQETIYIYLLEFLASNISAFNPIKCTGSSSASISICLSWGLIVPWCWFLWLEWIPYSSRGDANIFNESYFFETNPCLFVYIQYCSPASNIHSTLESNSCISKICENDFISYISNQVKKILIFCQGIPGRYYLDKRRLIFRIDCWQNAHKNSIFYY